MNLFMHIQHQLEKVTTLAYDVNKSLAKDSVQTPSMNPQAYQTNCNISQCIVRSCTIGAWQVNIHYAYREPSYNDQV